MTFIYCIVFEAQKGTVFLSLLFSFNSLDGFGCSPLGKKIFFNYLTKILHLYVKSHTLLPNINIRLYLGKSSRQTEDSNMQKRLYEVLLVFIVLLKEAMHLMLYKTVPLLRIWFFQFFLPGQQEILGAGNEWKFFFPPTTLFQVCG